MLVLTVTTEMAAALTSALERTDTATPAVLQPLLDYTRVAHLDISPMFPGIDDPELNTYFVLQARDPDPDPGRMIEDISTLTGVTGIYWKPDEGIPL
jgi:hypothetical protein